MQIPMQCECSLDATLAKADHSGSGIVYSSFSNRSFRSSVMQESKTKWLDALLILTGILDPSARIQKATFRFSVSLLNTFICRMLILIYSSFVEWLTEVGSSTPCLWVTMPILLFVPATIVFRRRRVKGTHPLKVGSSSTTLVTVK